MVLVVQFSITHRKDLYKKIDRAVFPGEQGGPHVNSVAGLAVAMSLTRTDQFHQLQHQIAKNAIILAEAIAQRGIRIAYGGTNTHMLLIDCKGIRGD
jgi:glycine hydroxymethyltransferase